MTRPLALVALIVGIVCIIVAVMYFIEPAASLPSFFPGYEATGTDHHTKHAIGALLVGLVLFAFAWFQSKPRKAA